MKFTEDDIDKVLEDDCIEGENNDSAEIDNDAVYDRWVRNLPAIRQRTCEILRAYEA